MNPHNIIRWTYWATICALLMVGLAGRPEALYLAVAVSFVQLVHYAVRERSLTAFPVQVRMVYAAVMLLDVLWEPMQWHLWMMAFFTLVLVLFDWCMLSRIMVLMPWNRRQPMSWPLVRTTFFSAPVKGSVMNRPAQQGVAA